jgi:hypothetical protein
MAAHAAASSKQSTAARGRGRLVPHARAKRESGRNEEYPAARSGGVLWPASCSRAHGRNLRRRTNASHQENEPANDSKARSLGDDREHAAKRAPSPLHGSTARCAPIERRTRASRVEQQARTLFGREIELHCAPHKPEARSRPTWRRAPELSKQIA